MLLGASGCTPLHLHTAAVADTNADTSATVPRMASTLRRRWIIYVDQTAGPDASNRFRVLVNGWLEYWSIDRIKEAVADGDDVREWER